MHYYVEYELCALLFLLVIAARFFEIRRFPNTKNTLFSIILICAVADLSLDIIGSVLIERADSVPLWLNYLVNTTFYSLQLFFLILMNLYILASAGVLVKAPRRLLLYFIPLAALELLLISNCFTRLIFYVSDAGVYTRGPLFNLFYLCLAFYICLAVFFALKHRAALSKKELRAIFCFFFVLCAAAALQFLFPAYLLTGVAITMAILIMFFIIQNPEDRLDLLTGMFNYSAMLEYFDGRFAKGITLYVFAADVGGIRRINSSLGTAFGNLLFEQLGAFFNSLGSDVLAFRFAGSRFVVISTSEHSLLRAAAETEQRFSRPWTIEGFDGNLSVTLRSFVTQDYFHSGQDIVNFVDLIYADLAADDWGTQKAVDDDMILNLRRRVTIENAMIDAISSGTGFELWFQPIYCTASRSFASAEVLLRFFCPELGMISPAEFIPIAEKNGLILQIDELVLRRSCDFLLRSGLSHSLRLERLEINISAYEFFRDPFVSLGSIVSGSGVPPQMFCFEVTETAASQYPELLNDFMLKMMDLGCSFALDDFGTGFANLSQVVSRPFSIVKFDRSLLVSCDEKSRLLFDSLAEMFSALGFSVVIEGVETQEQAERAAAHATDYIQGFFYARPMPEKDFLEFLEDH